MTEKDKKTRAKKKKEVEDHLKDIKYLLAGIILNKKPNIKAVAKVIGCSDKTLTKFYPEKKNAKRTKD